MELNKTEVGTNPTQTGNILPKDKKELENNDISDDGLVTSTADSVTLSDEAIALSELDEQRNGGDGNGELPTRPPKEP